MQFSILQDLLKSTGRAPRVNYALAMAVLIVSVIAQGWFIGRFGQSLFGFFAGLIWLCINLYLMYCVYARRLHDVSLSVGPLFVAILLTILTIAFTVWAGGGGDYFNALMENPEIAEDAAASEALIRKYQADLAQNASWAKWVNLMPLTLLTLYCAVMPGK